MTFIMRLLDQFNLHHVLAEVPGTVLVMFTGPDCGACRRVKALLADVVVAAAGTLPRPAMEAP